MLEHKYKVMISGSAFRLYEEGANHITVSPTLQHLDWDKIRRIDINAEDTGDYY